MKRFLLIAALTSALLPSVGPCRAQEAIEKARADAFDVRMFEANPGDKAYVCFQRRYDAEHLAQHPKQQVAAMKLLLTAELPEGEKTLGYSFRLGVKYRSRAGDFDSIGFCNHAITKAKGDEIGFACAVDCDGGGIDVALSGDDRSAIIRLERITVWNQPDEEADEALLAGADDKIFRLDRTDTRECASLVTDRKELAAIRHK